MGVGACLQMGWFRGDSLYRGLAGGRRRWSQWCLLRMVLEYRGQAQIFPLEQLMSRVVD